MSKSKHVVLGVTGSIAAYKAADLIRRLQEKGFKVSVVMTKDAEYFITPLTLSALSQDPVYRWEMSAGANASQMPHIELAKAADVFLVAPATANIIGKMAGGIGDDLLTCLFLAVKGPVVVAPAMNTQMYQHPLVQANCQKLKDIGVRFVEPKKGKLACGDVGAGHIAPEDEIIKAVERSLK